MADWPDHRYPFEEDFRTNDVAGRPREWAGARGRQAMNRSDLAAIEIALDELEAYVDTVGTEDEAHERQKWAIRKLRKLVARERAGENA